MLLRRRATVESQRLVAAYLRIQAGLMQREEQRWCPTVDLNVAVSDPDAEALARIAPGATITVVPNGVDTGVFAPANVEPLTGLVFVGGTTWFPNRDALMYFTTEIHPLLERIGVDAPTEWVGRATPTEIRQHQRPAFRLTGYVEDIRPYVQRAACYIVPLRVGGGTRLKILDAWAMGKAVVSTSVGCEGLQATDGENILIRDTPQSFAQAIKDVLTDHVLRDRLGRNARRTAVNLYDWEVIGAQMWQSYRAVIGSSSAAVRKGPFVG